MTDESRQQLEDIKFLLSQNVAKIKPIFGFMFWQLAAIEEKTSPEEMGREGINLTMTDEEDEVIAAFIAAYIKLWESAGDLNAASRFVASTLGMSAEELFQCRQVYLDQLS